MSLDEAYVVTNSDMRWVLRVELDSNWKSWSELEAAIASLAVEGPGSCGPAETANRRRDKSGAGAAATSRPAAPA